MLPLSLGPVHPDVLFAYQSLSKGQNEAEIAKLYRLAALRRRIHMTIGAATSLVLYKMWQLRNKLISPSEVNLPMQALKGLLLGTYYGSMIYPIGVHPITRMLERTLIAPVGVAAVTLGKPSFPSSLSEFQTNPALAETWLWAGIRGALFANIVGLALDYFRYGSRLTPVREDPPLAVKILREYPPPPTPEMMEEITRSSSKSEESVPESPEAVGLQIPDIDVQDQTSKSGKKKVTRRI